MLLKQTHQGGEITLLLGRLQARVRQIPVRSQQSHLQMELPLEQLHQSRAAVPETGKIGSLERPAEVVLKVGYRRVNRFQDSVRRKETLRPGQDTDGATQPQLPALHDS